MIKLSLIKGTNQLKLVKTNWFVVKQAVNLTAKTVELRISWTFSNFNAFCGENVSCFASYSKVPAGKYH